MFDPWTATPEDARIAMEQMVADGQNVLAPDNPLVQMDTANDVTAARDRIEAGDGFLVLSCIRLCVTHRLVAPEWLASAFNRCFDAVLSCRADSWDSPLAFGKPYEKGKHLHALRKAGEGRLRVWCAMYELIEKNPDTPINKITFGAVGQQLNFGATETERYYYEAIKTLGLPNLKKS